MKNAASSRLAGQKQLRRDWTPPAQVLRRLAAVVLDLNDAILVYDLQGRLQTWNRGAQRMYGYSEAEALKMNISDMVPEPKQAEAKVFMERLEKGERVTSFETQRFTKDGRLLDVWLTVTLLTDDSGSPVAVASTERDITERKKVEELLRATLVQLEGQKKALDEFAIVTETDAKGKITYVNDQFCKTSKYSREELIGKDHRDVANSGYHSKEHWQNFWAAIQAGKTWRGDVCNKAKDGTIYWEDTTIVPFLGKDGKPEKYLAIRANITERKRAEELRERAVSQLESINKELAEFAYAVSHDLKAPLRGIDSLAGWIAEDFRDKLDEEGKKNLGMLQARVKKMHALIDGILEYSRIGRTREEIETIDLNRLLPGIIELLSPPAHIQIEIQKKLPVIKAEKTRIHQVFQNLLSNAIKHAGRPQGKIKVGCETGAGFWRFSVSDNGPGIEEKYHGRIFGLFQTLDSTETSENTGVGLSLVKKIVELYGGKAGVKSKPGQGSTFWFTFPKTYGTQGGENQ